MINFIRQHSSLKASVCNEIFRQSLPREAKLQNNYKMKNIWHTNLFRWLSNNTQTHTHPAPPHPPPLLFGTFKLFTLYGAKWPLTKLELHNTKTLSLEHIDNMQNKHRELENP